MDGMTQNENMLPLGFKLEGEHGIIISPCEVPSVEDSGKYIILADKAAELSPLISALPSLGTALETQKALGQTAYSITFNGQNVLPEQLVQKGNRAYISNLKSTTGGGLGKQTDITPIDSSKAQMANVANAAFSLASAATATYYLKRIDERLGDIQKTAKSILLFLEADKQAQIRNDINLLQQITEDIASLKDNMPLLDSHLNMVGNIRREQGKNTIFYQEKIKEELITYVEAAKNKKREKESVKKLRQYYQNYRISSAAYAMARLLEVWLSEHFDVDYLSRLRIDLQRQSDEFVALHDSILNTCFIVGKGKLSTKVGLSQSNLYENISNKIMEAPLNLMAVSDFFYTKAGEKEENVRRRALSDAFKILGEKWLVAQGMDEVHSRDGFQVIEPFLKVIKSMEATYSNPIKMIVSGDDVFLEIQREQESLKPKME